MSPVPRIAPPPPAVADLIREITEAWQLNDILDALPRGLNPWRTKDVMKWGVDFITRLRDLAILTPGGHDGVVTSLMQRASQPITTIRPDAERWTVIRDIDHLILQVDPLTAAALQVNQNAPRRATSGHEGRHPVIRGRRLAIATRHSERIANRTTSRSTPAAHGRAAAGGNAQPSGTGVVRAGGRGKRGRDQEDDEPLAENDDTESRKRTRTLKSIGRDRYCTARGPPGVAEQQKEEVNGPHAIDQIANQVADDDEITEAAQENNSSPVVAAQEENEMSAAEAQDETDEDDDLARDMTVMTFEQRYPLPEDAYRARRIEMLKLLKKRNQAVRREGGEHIDVELDYRIALEEDKEEHEMAWDQADD